MGLSFTIGGASFAALAMTAGRKALDMQADSPEYEIIRYHVKGVTGSYLTRGGRIGTPIKARMRYIGASVAAATALFNTDVVAWQNTAVSITAHDGVLYTRCQLDPGSMRQLSIKASGRGAAVAVFLDAEASFTSDD